MALSRVSSTIVFFFASAAIASVACSSSTASGSSSSSGGGSTPACSDVCAHLASVCGQAVPNCDSTCGNWSADTRSCANGISSCNALQGCVTSGGGDGGSGTGDSGSSTDGSTYKCGADNCTGCCQGNDCVDGTDTQHCGAKGENCTVCTTCHSNGNTFEGTCQN